MKSLKVRRPYRFITMAILLSTFTIFLSNAIFDTGVLLHTRQGQFVGWVAGLSSLLILIGLLGKPKWDRFLHYGLLTAGFAWITRTAFIGLSDGLSAFAFWLSLAWVIVIVGTYLLETYDPKKRVSDGTST